MADSVIIEGLGSNVDKWASAKTQFEILAILKRTSKLNEDQLEAIRQCCENGSLGGGGSGPDDVSDDYDVLDRALRDTTDTTRRLNASEQILNTSTKKLNASLKKLSTVGTGLLGNFVGSIFKQVGMISELNESGFNLGKNLRMSSDELISFSQLNENAGKSMAEVAEESNNVSAGMHAFVTSSKQANLTLKELSELGKQYGTVINQMGVIRFTRMSKVVTESLSNIGVASTEGAELMAEYLEQQRLIGLNATVNDHKTRLGAQQQIRDINLWSKTLGLSRKEIQKGITEGRKSIDVQAFLNRKLPSVAKNFDTISASIGAFSKQQGSDFGQKLLESIAQPNIQQSQLLIDLFNANMPTAAIALMNFSQIVKSSTSTQGDVESGLEHLMETLANADTRTAQTIGDTSTALGAANLAGQWANISKSIQQQLADQELQAQQANAVTESFKRMRILIDTIVSEIFTKDNVAKFEKIIALIPAVLSKLIPMLSDIGKGIVNVILPGIAGVSSVFTSMTDTVGVFGAALAGLAAYISLKVIGRSIMDRFTGGGAGGGGSGGGGGPGGGRAGRGLGGALTSIGRGLGKGLGGILEGIGLAFAVIGRAGPVVAKGGLYLGLALGGFVAALGAGFAAAAALLGLALPTFADGLKSFEELDAELLSSVGDAVLNLGKGILAMGAGGFLNTLSNIGEAFLSFFSGGSLADKLLELSKIPSAPIEALGLSLGVFASGLDLFTMAVEKFNKMDLDDLEDVIAELTDVDFSNMPAITQITNIGSGIPLSQTADQDNKLVNYVAKKEAEEEERDNFVEVLPTVSKISERDAEINTILTRHTELLEILVLNSTKLTVTSKRMLTTAKDQIV